MKVRYIRDWLNGSDKDIRNFWSQIQVLDYNNTNIAIGKTVTSSGPVFGTLANLPNGTTIESDYGDFDSVTLDLDTVTLNSYWQVEEYQGKKCISNKPIGHSNSRTLEIPINLATSTELTCEVAVSSENGYDYFTVLMNNTQKYRNSGTFPDLTPLSLGTYNAGTHTLKLQYSKDSSGDGGTDRGYIADIAYGGYDGSVTEPTLSYVQVDLGDVMDVASIVTKHKVYNNVSYNTKLEVSEDGVEWVCIYDSAINGVYVETSNGKTHNLRTMYKFKFDGDKFNGMPSPISVDDIIFTTLPYRPTGYYNNKQLRMKLSSFNGYPVIHDGINPNGSLAATNLPLRFCSPKSKHMWQINSDILDGYPSQLRMDPSFDKYDVIAHISDDHYVTPLRAKLLIHKYISEFTKSRGKRKSPLVTNIQIEEKRERLLLTWENPDDDNWDRTLIIKSTKGFASIDPDTNAIIYPSDWDGNTIVDNAKLPIEQPLEITGLTNGTKYYFTFITASKSGYYNTYPDAHKLGTPKILYTPQYGHFGEYIGKVAIPVGED